MIEIVPDERAFYISDLNAVVVADLHIGYEISLRESGITLQNSTSNMIERLEKLLKMKKADKIIILGDVKHSIGPCRNVKKLEELPAKIIVVKGNHDGNIEEMLDVEIHGAEGVTIGEYGFMHGHSWPDEEVMRKKYVFMGHLHPEIELSDSLGHLHRYPCHLAGGLTELGKKKYGSNPKVFVLSAFNPFVGSSIVDPLGPLMRNGIIGNFDVYLLNGTYLGKLEALRR